MKKLFLVLALMVGITAVAKSQVKVQLFPFAGYTFQDKFYLYEGDGKISDGMTYGGSLTAILGMFNAVELTYSRQDVECSGTYYYYDSRGRYTSVSDQTAAAMNYVFIGGSRLFPIPNNDKLNMFTGLDLGVGWLVPSEDQYSTVTKFSMGIKGGMKYMFSDKIGIRLQANLNFPVTNLGAGVMFGSGGASAGVTGYVPILQFGFNGGLLINLN